MGKVINKPKILFAFNVIDTYFVCWWSKDEDIFEWLPSLSDFKISTQRNTLVKDLQAGSLELGLT